MTCIENIVNIFDTKPEMTSESALVKRQWQPNLHPTFTTITPRATEIYTQIHEITCDCSKQDE